MPMLNRFLVGSAGGTVWFVPIWMAGAILAAVVVGAATREAKQAQSPTPAVGTP